MASLRLKILTRFLRLFPAPIRLVRRASIASRRLLARPRLRPDEPEPGEQVAPARELEAPEATPPDAFGRLSADRPHPSQVRGPVKARALASRARIRAGRKDFAPHAGDRHATEAEFEASGSMGRPKRKPGLAVITIPLCTSRLETVNRKTGSSCCPDRQKERLGGGRVNLLLVPNRAFAPRLTPGRQLAACHCPSGPVHVQGVDFRSRSSSS